MSKPEEYVSFGDISRSQLGQQSQYGSRYVNGEIEGYPNLGEGLRFLGDPADYHALLIHNEDVKEFVRRVKAYKQNKRGEVYMIFETAKAEGWKFEGTYPQPNQPSHLHLSFIVKGLEVADLAFDDRGREVQVGQYALWTKKK